MSERATTLAKLLLERTSAEDLAEVHAILGAAVGIPNTPPAEPVNTIVAIDSDITPWNSIISLAPSLGVDGWDLYIPPTTRDAFDYEDELEFDPYESDVKEGLGETGWETLEGAVLALLIAVRRGDIKYNDGRVAQ